LAYAISFVGGKEMEPKIFTAELSRIGFSEADWYSYVFDLDKSRKYLIGIDQSANCTGVSLVTDNFDFIAVFTIPIDDKSASKFLRYIPLLEEFLIQMTMGLDVKYVVYENVPPIKYKNQKILFEMKGIVESWIERVPALKAVESDFRFCPMPNQWKSFVFDKKDRGPGRENAFRSKVEISRDIVKKMNVLEPYFVKLCEMKGHDFDGMDAFGMVLASRFIYLTASWELVNKSVGVQLGMFHVFFKYVTAESVGVDVCEGHLLWGLTDFIRLDMFDVREWNAKESIYKNYVMAANTNKIIMMECVDARHILAVLIESGIDWEEGRLLYCFVCKEIVVRGLIDAISKGSVLLKSYY
jgi:hypothetical protein